MTQPVSTEAGALTFDENVLATWLKEKGLLDKASLTVKPLTGGQSNPTYLLTSGQQRYVLRKKPPGPLLPSAHAVDREYRVMQALQNSAVPVPKLFAFSEELEIVGTPFYIMEYLDGRVIVDQSLPTFSKEDRSLVYQDMNRVIAALHSVDYATVGLETFGKPGNYFGRQIARWSRQYKEANTEDIPALHALIEWLPANIPVGEQTSIVHGDYRLDNLVLHPTELDLVALGIPDEAQYLKRYSQTTGLDGAEHWDFYIAYNLFRIAAILQGIARRAADGTAASSDALETGNKARPLAEIGWKYAQRYACSR